MKKNSPFMKRAMNSRLKKFKIKNQRQRVIAVFCLMTFLNTLVPYNVIYASGNGPTAPEATGFEPVDATDMVNLNTGGFTYVLPLLNVPSPEGGYPLALSYHAGIAVDQTPSWVGMGWALNPGAISRSVNGYPDDYQGAQITDFFYDNGDRITSYSAGVSVSLAGGPSVGLGMSWGSHQSLGGYISVGFGITEMLGGNVRVGTDGASIGIGVKSGMMSFGLDVSTDGTVGANIGVSGGENSAGFSVGARTDGTFSAAISMNGTDDGFYTKTSTTGTLGVSFTKDGLSGISVRASQDVYTRSALDPLVFTGDGVKTQKSYKGSSSVGVNMSMGLSRNMAMGDYVSNNSRMFMGLIIPIGKVFISLSFSKSTYEYMMAKNRANYMTGPLHFNEELRYETMYKIKKNTLDCLGKSNSFRTIVEYTWVLGEEAKDKYIEDNSRIGNKTCRNITRENVDLEWCEIVEEIEYSPMQDIYEFPVDEYGLGKVSHLLGNNAVFPAYDSFNVQAQGISGSMSLRMHENAALFGMKDVKGELSYTASYEDFRTSFDTEKKFDDKPHFEFDNEITNFLQVSAMDVVNATINYSNIKMYYDGGVLPKSHPRRYTSNYVEHYTYRDIKKKYDEGTLLSEGFLFSDGQGRNNVLFTPPGSRTDLYAVDSKIAAFKVTSMDGKTYHYSLPVYNYETITRNFGNTKKDENPRPEREAYMEKRQLSPYATHWLLTAITGPDFIDVNGNGTADDGDYGYWTRFEYGKWSDGFIWKSPFNEDYHEDLNTPHIKSYSRGRKEVYYLNKVKTRTHTAIFVKELDVNNPSFQWRYESVKHENAKVARDRGSYNYVERFTVPQEYGLKLSSIYLFKNEDADDIHRWNSGSYNSYEGYHFPDSALEEGSITLKQSNYNSVITKEDISSSLESKCLKKIELNEQNTETQGYVKTVEFLGKGGVSVMPPYRFSHNSLPASNSEKDDWGYMKGNPVAGSLKEIQTPTGGRLLIEYEENQFYKPTINKGRQFNTGLAIEVLDIPSVSNHYKPHQAEQYKERYQVKVTRDTLNPYISPIDFRDYFETDKETDKETYVDIWLSAVRNFSGDGFHRSSIDVLPQFAAVLSVTEEEMLLEVEASSPFRNRGYETAQRLPEYKIKEIRTTYNPKTREESTYIYEEENQRRGRYDLAWVSESESRKEAYSLVYTLVGNKKVPHNSFGGGIRVKSITSVDNQGGEYGQEYDYSYPSELLTSENLDQETSGVLSYVPHKYNEHIPYSSQLPTPRVMYEYVKLTQQDGSHTDYHFKVMKNRTSESELKFSNFYEVEQRDHGSESPAYNADSKREVKVTSFTVKENMSGLGSLLSTKQYNKQGHMLGESINHYFSFEELEESGLGVTQEAYQMYKTVSYDDATTHAGAPLDSEGMWFVTSSIRKRYPSLLKATTSISGGYKFTTEFLNFDEKTGQAHRTRTYSSQGQELIVDNTLAFSIPEYANMGHKRDIVTNKHMISQPAYSISKLIDSEGVHIFSAYATTWNNEWSYENLEGIISPETDENKKVWRKHKEYSWEGEIDEVGFYKNFDTISYDGFNWTVGSDQDPTSKWKETSENTLYNRYSKLLEVKDINGNYASSKMCDEDTKTLAVSNAKYEDMYYSGMEYGSEAGVALQKTATSNSVSSTGVVIQDAHTGAKYIVSSGSDAILEVVVPAAESHHRDGKYKFSVWVDAASILADHYPTFTDATLVKEETVFSGDWALVTGELIVPKAGKTYTLTAGASNQKFDDFRLYPITSAMTSYVYNQWDELSYIIGDNGLATHYEYNDAGELRRVETEVIDFKGPGTGGFKLSATHKKIYKK
ncbi:MAG: hypothetical protein PQJ49_00350 [Sphaerochaetaceae bacterium]|nr:hypothetical protein [Sphaerochaetaceae bacterium]